MLKGCYFVALSSVSSYDLSTLAVVKVVVWEGKDLNCLLTVSHIEC